MGKWTNKLVCTVVEAGAQFVVKDCGFEDQVFGVQRVAGSATKWSRRTIVVDIVCCDEQPPAAAT